MRLEMVKLGHCPLCGKDRDLRCLFDLRSFGVFLCPCGMKFIDPCLSAGAMMELYRSSEALSEINPALEQYYEYDTSNPRTKTYRDYLRALEELSKTVSGREMLEVGCGQGAFLKAARNTGWKATGLDSAPENIASLEREGIEGICSDFLSYPGSRQFDAVVLWDLIEHPQAPGEFIRKARSLLKASGVLLIATPHDPNLLSLVAAFLYRVSGGKIKGPLERLYLLEHTTYFSSGTLEKLSAREGVSKVALWKTETDLARYRFSAATGFFLRVFFFFARCLGLQNRVMLIARKEGGE